MAAIRSASARHSRYHDSVSPGVIRSAVVMTSPISAPQKEVYPTARNASNENDSSVSNMNRMINSLLSQANLH